MESWSKKKMEEAGLFYDFVQDNHSKSTVKGTLRGIRFQKGDKSQAKLVRCVKGAVFDVAVDLRKNSPTFKQWVGVELSAENKKQLAGDNRGNLKEKPRTTSGVVFFCHI